MVLLWSLLNLLVLLSVVYIFLKAAKLVRQHLGLAATLFFCFSLFLITGSGSRMNGTSATGSPKNLLSGIPEDTPLGNASSMHTIDLGMNKMYLLAEYHAEQGLYRPRGLFVTMSGLTLGHNWQPIAGMLLQRGKQLHYDVVVLHDWNLLGIKMYTQSQQLDGMMPLSNPNQ